MRILLIEDDTVLGAAVRDQLLGADIGAVGDDVMSRVCSAISYALGC